MGCDIHLFVEYESNGSFESFSEGQIELPRNYAVFCALAGVRGRRDPLYEPRGIPSLSAPADRAYWFEIVDRPEPSSWREEVSLADAHGYVERGRSVMREYGEFRFVSDPDAHTPSYLSHEELWATLAHHELDPAELHPVYQALFAVLSALTELNPRVVFWFDN